MPLYSLIETAKANNLNPYDYLTWIFKTVHLSSFVVKVAIKPETHPPTLDILDPRAVYIYSVAGGHP